MEIRFKSLMFTAFVVFATALSAQPFAPKAGTPIIFTYQNHPVSVEEFEYQYLKNKKLGEDNITEADIDEYLDLYIKFKLKYEDAREAGMDTLKDYITELAGYRSQLARNYLYDKEVTDALIAEAYDRMQFEVKAAHILIMVDPNAKPSDTLIAYNKLRDALNSINSGKSSFEAEAARLSDDPGSKDNGGDLGYFTAMQLVYPFENVAYTTEKGKISAIFRTQFGYHIIKVLDKRKNRGEIKVRHIQLRVGHKQEASEEAVKQQVDEIYKQISNGESSFDNMAFRYSEDYNSKNNGGEMDYISVSQFVGDPVRQAWADIAFNLASDGAVSEPFRTEMGWHILQRVKVRPLGTFEQMRSTIKNQVRNDMRSQKSVDVLVEKVKAENNFTEFSSSYDALVSSLDSNYLLGKFEKSLLPEFATATKPAKPVRGNVFLEPNLASTPLRNLELFQLGGEKHTVGDFADYIEKNAHPFYGKKEEGVKEQYNLWVNESCVSYQDRHLEEKSAEFRNIFQEYSEGILMFYRKKDKVWDRANTDSAGLAQFFEQTREKYTWQDRVYCQVYFCNSETTLNAVAKQVKKKVPADSIKLWNNKVKALSVDYKTGKYELTDNYLFADKKLLPDLFLNKKAKKKNAIIKMGQYGEDWVVVKVLDWLPAGYKQLNETRGPVTAQYEEYLEALWIKELQGRYTVEVNNTELASLKKKLLNR